MNVSFAFRSSASSAIAAVAHELVVGTNKAISLFIPLSLLPYLPFGNIGQTCPRGEVGWSGNGGGRWRVPIPKGNPCTRARTPPRITHQPSSPSHPSPSRFTRKTPKTKGFALARARGTLRGVRFSLRLSLRISGAREEVTFDDSFPRSLHTEKENLFLIGREWRFYEYVNERKFRDGMGWNFNSIESEVFARKLFTNSGYITDEIERF